METLYVTKTGIAATTGLDSLEREQVTELKAARLASMPGLETLQGLENLEKVGELTLAELPRLVHVQALSKLAEAQHLCIDACRALGTYEPLQRVAVIGIAENHPLQRIEGFARLREVTARLEVCSNNRLREITGFPVLEKVGQLEVAQNHALVDLGPLNRVSEFGRLDTSCMASAQPSAESSK